MSAYIPSDSPAGERGRSHNTSSSKWSGKPQKIVYLEEGKPIYTIIANCLTPEQIDSVQSLIRIDEVTKLLRSNQFVPNDPRDRSPSPPPIYDSTGKRTNTRENRYRKKYETERSKLIEKALNTIPNFKPPEDYKRPTKTVEKLYIPVKDYPSINFIGLLIGPRGNNLKSMQEESGARIAIRGKGSVKEGKNTSSLKPEQNNLEDPLHCLITSESDEKIQKAKILCQKIIDKAINAPEGQNDLKREQLKELAILNGTLRLEEDRICPTCGGKGHKRYDCPNLDKSSSMQGNFTQSLICSKCGNVGHFAKDCKVDINVTAKIDQEFAMMMKDLTGEGDDQQQLQPQQQQQQQQQQPPPPPVYQDNYNRYQPQQRLDYSYSQELVPSNQPQYGYNKYNNGYQRNYNNDRYNNNNADYTHPQQYDNAYNNGYNNNPYRKRPYNDQLQQQQQQSPKPYGYQSLEHTPSQGQPQGYAPSYGYDSGALEYGDFKRQRISNSPSPIPQTIPAQVRSNQLRGPPGLNPTNQPLNGGAPPPPSQTSSIGAPPGMKQPLGMSFGALSKMSSAKKLPPPPPPTMKK